MSLIIGVDVGGTHADGVLMDGKEVKAKYKVSVNQENLSESVITLLKRLVPESGPGLDRIHLSTTLCTNSIVNDTLDTVGMIIQSGPGLNPDFFNCGGHVRLMNGAIDHRGHVLKDPDQKLIDKAADDFIDAGITSIGIVTKFSHRNNSHERLIHDRISDRFPHISMGHLLSGKPNFPRRVYSAWLNAALKTDFTRFKEAMNAGFSKLGLDCPCSILKADGGTVPFDTASSIPAESIHSGPSASVMGCLALYESSNDAVLLDIGGTTTDIAILAEGSPLLEPYGITINGRPTLIRALNTRSIGLGGDSVVVFYEGQFLIGPHRQGQPMALGGPVPTPTDAMIVLGTLDTGSEKLAAEAMQRLVPDQPPETTASLLLAAFTERIKQEVDLMIQLVFSRPVYTVKALLNRKMIEPTEIIVVGGPAEAMRSNISRAFGLPCSVPNHYEVANAVGSARTRPTLQATLYADTSDGTLSIPETGTFEKITKGFRMQDAEHRLQKVITDMARQYGMTHVPNIDFLEPQEMNTVEGFYTSGKIISLKAQIQPGLERI